MLGLAAAIWLLCAPGQTAPTKVINLKSFLEWDTWQLDITYSAKDTFSDRDHSASLEMTATATYILKRLDKQDAWGHWQTLECQSNNLVYKAFWKSHHDPARTDYASKSGPMVAPLAEFQIGGQTPGYMLVVNGGFPAEMRDSLAGVLECPLVLGTTIKDQPGLSGVVTGPLPERGTTIQGSRVIPYEVAPFLTGQAGLTRMGIQYVVKPVPLSPLTR